MWLCARVKFLYPRSNSAHIKCSCPFPHYYIKHRPSLWPQHRNWKLLVNFVPIPFVSSRHILCQYPPQVTMASYGTPQCPPGLPDFRQKNIVNGVFVTWPIDYTKMLLNFWVSYTLQQPREAIRKVYNSNQMHKWQSLLYLTTALYLYPFSVHNQTPHGQVHRMHRRTDNIQPHTRIRRGMHADK